MNHSRQVFRPVLFFFCVFYVSTAVQASPVDSVRSDTLLADSSYTITVTATRNQTPLLKSTGAVSVVSKASLDAMPRGIAADEALVLVPGVRVENQADGERVHMSIRGKGILSEHGLRGIGVLLDGIPLSDPTGFVSDLYDIDWETVRSIEVLRGPAAAIYGCASNAGLLNITTENAPASRLGGMGYASFGSNGFGKILGQVGASESDNSFRTTLSHTYGDGSRMHEGFWGDIFSFKDVWKPTSGVTITPLFTYSNFFNNNAEGLDSATASANPSAPNDEAIPFNEYLKTTKLTGGATLKAAITQDQSIDLMGFVRSTSFRESNNHYFDIQTILTPGGSAQYNWNAKLPSFTNYLTIGGDYKSQTLNEAQLPHIHDEARIESKGDWSEDVLIPIGVATLADQTITQMGAGAFLQDQVDIGKLTLMGNLRYDYVSNKLHDMMDFSRVDPVDSTLVPIPGSTNSSGEANFDQVTARIGGSYSFCEALNIFADWGLGFLPPATDELISNPLKFGGFNSSLLPSRSSGEELGVRGSAGKQAGYEMTGFLLDTRNDFYRYRLAHSINDTTQDRSQETFYGNAGESKRYGVEFAGALSPIDSLTFQAAYTYSHFTYTAPADIDGHFLPNSPQHQLNAQVDYRFLPGLTASLSAEYQSDWYIYTDTRNYPITQKGFALLDGRLAYAWKMGTLRNELSFSVKNILDKAWIAFTEPDVDGETGDPANSYQPGPGREFFLSLKTRF